MNDLDRTIKELAGDIIDVSILFLKIRDTIYESLPKQPDLSPEDDELLRRERAIEMTTREISNAIRIQSLLKEALDVGQD
jgi:hypothetical protein